MACKGRGPLPGPEQSSLTSSTGYLSRNPLGALRSRQNPVGAQRALLDSSSLFNHGDPDLSFCDELVLADSIETESDQPSTVDVEEFTDLMLFPDLMGVFDDDLPAFKDFPIDPIRGGVDDDVVKSRQAISSVASSNGEVSPAESDASVDHFFNTFTDLATFLDDLNEEAGPSELNDYPSIAHIAGSNEPITTVAVLPRSAATTTTPPTPVGSEAESTEGSPTPRRRARPTNDEGAPPSKKSRSSRLTAREKYRHRRDKNNVASQRSRATRKQREKDMSVQVEELEADNSRLRLRIDELSVIAEDARKCLVEALSQK